MRAAVAFVSHGSPMYALKPGQAGAALAQWARSIDAAGETPSAVIMMSPHWMTPGISVTGAAQPATWHDFGGFAPELYELQYPAAGHPQLAEAVQQLALEVGLDVHIDTRRPFDHGAWVPMMHMWPEANIPMVQISLPITAAPRSLMALGAALVPLREQGVMVMGSGSMTHNLGDVFRSIQVSADNELPYVRPFANWIIDTLQKQDDEGLCDFERLAPNAAQAHPTTEHLLPLFFARGACMDSDTLKVLTQEVQYAGLAMDSVVWS